MSKNQVKKLAERIFQEFKSSPSPYRVCDKMGVRVEANPVVEQESGPPIEVNGWCITADRSFTICVREGEQDMDRLIAHEVAHLYTSRISEASARLANNPIRKNREDLKRWEELTADLIADLYVRAHHHSGDNNDKTNNH